MYHRIGRKKLKQLESEIQRLTSIRHENLLSLVAVKLSVPHSNENPRLCILTEQRPTHILHDVLEDCDSLREERASVCYDCASSGFRPLKSHVNRIILLKYCLL